MTYQIFSPNEWVYPDTPLTVPGTADLHSPRGADVCFQVLIDRTLAAGEQVGFSFASSIASRDSVSVPI